MGKLFSWMETGGGGLNRLIIFFRYPGSYSQKDGPTEPPQNVKAGGGEEQHFPVVNQAQDSGGKK